MWEGRKEKRKGGTKEEQGTEGGKEGASEGGSKRRRGERGREVDKERKKWEKGAGRNWMHLCLSTIEVGGKEDIEDTHLEPLSIGKGWLHPSDDEDGSHSQDRISNDHEDAMCPNEVCAHNVHAHLPYTGHGVHSGITDGGVWPMVIGKAPITTYRERRKQTRKLTLLARLRCSNDILCVKPPSNLQLL